MSRDDGLVPDSPEGIAHEAAKEEARREASLTHALMSHLNQEEVRVQISLHDPIPDEMPEEQSHFEAHEGGFHGDESGKYSASVHPTHGIIRGPLAIAAAGAVLFVTALAATFLLWQALQSRGLVDQGPPVTATAPPATSTPATATAPAAAPSSAPQTALPTVRPTEAPIPSAGGGFVCGLPGGPTCPPRP